MVSGSGISEELSPMEIDRLLVGRVIWRGGSVNREDSLRVGHCMAHAVARDRLHRGAAVGPKAVFQGSSNGRLIAIPSRRSDVPAEKFSG